MSEDKIRVALETSMSAFAELRATHTPFDDDFLAQRMLQIEDALAMKSPDASTTIYTAEDVQLARAAGYNEGLTEADTRNAKQVQRLIRSAHEEGFREGCEHTEQRISHAQPYEIETDIGVKYSAKGECQPEGSVKITRKLESDNQISDLIKADWTRGVEEIMSAIAEIKKRNVGV